MHWRGCWSGASPAELRGCVPNSASPAAPQEVSLGRRIANQGATAFAVLAAILVLVPLLAIFVYLLIKGIGSVNLAFLTQTPKPPGEVGGGMANAIVGTGLILAVASVIGLPLGIGSGIYLAEYGRNRFGDLIRFTADVLNGVPSIVIGIAVYSLVVVPQKHFSAFSGGVALGIMMIPTIARATEEMLLMVPNVIREAAYGLGIPKWRTTLSISLRTASAGVITGCMLAFARVAGETAPLLFTAFGNQFWNLRADQPTAALPLQIFNYAISPYDEWHRKAWYGKTQALYDVQLTVAANHATALIGPSGCGKSTFIRCLNRMHETIPEARVTGSVRIGDIDAYDGTSATQLRRRVGMVFQKANPFPTMSIYDNVASGLKLNGFSDRRKLDEIVEKSLEVSALWEEVKDQVHKKSGASLSGGQQQRLCIARALAVEPEVLLMDEPCSALDPISTGKIEELIFQLKERYTIVIVTHNMQQAARVAEFTGFFLLGRMIEFDR